MPAVIARPLVRIILAYAIVHAAAASTDLLIRSSREASMQDVVYTLGVWKVKPGQEVEFVAAWKELGEIFVRSTARRVPAR